MNPPAHNSETGRVGARPSDQALVSDQARSGLDPSGFDPSRGCGCYRCTKERLDADPGETLFDVPMGLMRMFLCGICGNKRCPHATDHRFACTASNEPGQLGSNYGPSEVPAISMWQPYASLVFETDPAFRKAHETRSFRYPAKYDGGRIAIQASAGFTPSALISSELHDLAVRAFGTDYRRTLPRGAYLGTVQLAGVADTLSLRDYVGYADRVAGIWSDGRFAWKFRDPRPLAEPISVKGKQGWWKAPVSLFAEAA